MIQAPVTRFLVFVNVGIHILRVLYSQIDAYSFDQTARVFGIVPVDFWAGAIWQPVTALFLHGGLVHLLVNMLSLWSLGEAVERTVGSIRFLLLYMISGLMSSLFVVIFQRTMDVPTLGASGALFGLLGALGVFYPKSMLLVFFIPMRAWTAVIFFGALSLAFIGYDHLTGSTSVFSHVGHLGGLLGGVLYTKLALQLPFLANELHGADKPAANPFQRFRRDTSGNNEADLRAAMEQLKEERKKGQAPDRGEDEPFNQPIREQPSGNPDGEERRVYFDPVTGRFYIR